MKTRFWNGFLLAVALAAFLLHSINTRGDTVYVWSEDGTIQKFAPNNVGTTLATNLPDSNGPVGLALDNAGNLYAGWPGGSSITKYTPGGIASIVGDSDSVSGLAFDKIGTLYVTSPNYFEIDIPNYSQSSHIYGSGPFNPRTQSHLNYPISLAFDQAGNLFALNGYQTVFGNGPFTNTIEKFSANLTDLGNFATNLNQPWGMAFDSAGNLYVSNSGTSGGFRNSILKFATDGSSSTFVNFAGGLSSPRGLAFDSAGDLYVASSGNGTIYKYALGTGGPRSFFASGLNSPTSIAIFPGLMVWSATPINLNNPILLPSGALQFSFNLTPGGSFSVLSTTNSLLPMSAWQVVGAATEISPGHYQFTDPQPASGSQRFYRLRSP